MPEAKAIPRRGAGKNGLHLFTRLKGKIRDKDKRRILQNLLSLSVLQGINALMPLVTLPYLVRVLGTEKFGLIAFAQSFIMYFQTLVSYGFEYTATRSISANRADREKISDIFSSVIWLKLILLAASVILISAIIFSFTRFSTEIELYYFTAGVLLGSVFYPTWFFQGIEDMKYITFFDFLSKLLYTLLILATIKSVSDYILVPLFNSFSQLIFGLAAIILVHRKYGIRLKLVSIRVLVHDLKEGFSVFITYFVPTLYNSSSIFILGVFGGPVLVGFYAAATKIVDILISFANIITRVYYPTIIRKAKHFFTYRKIIMSAGLAISIVTFFLSGPLVNILYSDSFAPTKPLLRILSFSIFFVSVIYCYGTNLLIAKKKDRLFMYISVVVSLFGFFLGLVLISGFDQYGAGISLLTTRFVFALTVFFFGQRLLKEEKRLSADS
jgi:PST family polysaccharide transporter